MNLIRSKKALIILATVVVVLGAYIYLQNQNGNPVLPGQKPDVTKQDQSLVGKVGNLILLPTDETPQVATVTDKTKLGDQSFFAKAENGDKVLIYVVNKEAILYRPSINKIIEVGPLGLPTPTAAIEQIQIASPTPTVKLLK